MEENMEFNVGTIVRLLMDTIDYHIINLEKRTIIISNGKDKFTSEQWFADIEDSKGIKVNSVNIALLSLVR